MATDPSKIVPRRVANCHPVTVNGKQLLINGKHWADCADEYKAIVTRDALEQFFCHCR